MDASPIPQTSITKHILLLGEDEESSKLLEGNICVVDITLLFDKAVLKTDHHSADSLIGIANLQKDLPTECCFKIGYFNTQIMKILHESIQDMKLLEVAHVSFELDPILLNESFKQLPNKNRIFLDLKFQLHLKERKTSMKDVEHLKLEGTWLRPEEFLKIDESKIYKINEYDLYELSEFHKRDANEMFKKGFVLSAFKRYHKSISFLIIAQQQAEFNQKLAKEDKLILPAEYSQFVSKLSQFKSQLYCNLAACQLKSGKSSMVIENCTRCLSLDRMNVKALFRRGQAYESLKEWEKAADDYKEARSLAPNDPAVQAKIGFVENLEKQFEQQQKKLAHNLQKMFK